MQRRIATIAILVVLLLCGAVWARMTTVVVGGPVVSAAPSSIDCSDADLLCESAEGNNSGYDNTGWTETETGGTVNPDAAHSGTFACNDKGSHAIDLTWASRGALYTQYVLGSTQATTYTQFYFNMVSKGTIASSNVLRLLYVDTNTDESAGAYYAGIYTGTSNYLRVYYYDGAGYTHYLVSTTAIVAGTWYRVGIYASGSTITLYVNGAQEGTASDLSIADRLPRYFSFGDTQGTPASGIDTARIQFDNIKIDATSMPGACP